MMSTEKSPALYLPANQKEENYSKNEKRLCSKSFVSWLLAALIVALLIALCIEFLIPISERRDTIDALHIYEGTPIDIRLKQIRDHTFSEPWHLDFLINPTKLCETWDDKNAYQKQSEVKLLMLVPSAICHFEHRRTIRRTWGSVAAQPHGAFRLGFVLGTPLNATEEALILEESSKYGDIIQADFEDTYQNLTTKSVLMLKWASKYCAHAQYFLKADDDTFVNLPVLAQILQKPPFDTAEKFIGGSIRTAADPFRMPSENFYDLDYEDADFPPYASGSAYVTRGSTLSDLFEASKTVKPFLPMEDVYITGFCADDIAATRIHDPSFQHGLTSSPSTWDNYESLATAHSVSPQDMDDLWSQVMKSLFDTLNMSSVSSSSSVSSDWSGSVLVSDIISWPQSKVIISGSLDDAIPSESLSGSSFNSLNHPDLKSSRDSSFSSLIFSAGEVPSPLALPSTQSKKESSNQASNPSESSQKDDAADTGVSVKLAGGVDIMPLQ